MNPETKIQREIMKFLRDNKILVWRVSDNTNMAGFPDLLVCYRGRFVALEVKVEAGYSKPTLQQEKVMNDINTIGKGVARIVRSVADVEKILSEAPFVSY